MLLAVNDGCYMITVRFDDTPGRTIHEVALVVVAGLGSGLN